MTNLTPPAEVTLVYREVGKTHVFTAPDLRGFHIGSSVLKNAYEQAVIALGQHVSRVFECSVAYRMARSFKEFENLLKKDDEFSGNFVLAKREMEDCAA
jgi:hypothetical protein